MESDGKKADAGDSRKGKKKHFGRLSSVFKSKHQKEGKDIDEVKLAKEPTVTSGIRTVGVVASSDQSISNASQTQAPVTDKAETARTDQEEQSVSPIKRRTLTWPSADKTENPGLRPSVEPPPSIHNSTQTQLNDLPNRTSLPSRDNPGNFVKGLKPIHDLWNEAYEDLKDKEETLVKDYEAIMSKNLVGVVVSANSTILGANGLIRHKEMKVILEEKLAQVKNEVWKLKFGDKVVPVQDLAAPVVGIINWTEQYINAAVSANPYASIAWAGVSLLLPLFLNPSRQAASMVKALEDVSNFIVRSTMREELYARRILSNSKSDQQEYRDTLKELYVRILKFQARAICYFSKQHIFRQGLDLVRWNDWDSLANDIAKQEVAFKAVYDIWKDSMAQEESEALSQRHREVIEALKVNELIASDLSGLKEAVELALKNEDRNRLLGWLSSIDPSSNYKIAVGKPKVETGTWLIRDNYDFDGWKTTPNSLIWLNGKAGSGKSVLSSTVIKHLEECYLDDPDSAIVYFYYSFNDTQKQNVEGMLCSLIRQLLCQRPDSPTPFLALRKYMDMGHRPDAIPLLNTFLASVYGFSRVFIVVDALDECPSGNNERENLLDTLSDIHSKEQGNLHIFCTSRRESDIEAAFKPLLRGPGNIDINLNFYEPAVEHDIGLHIDKMFAARAYHGWREDIKSDAKELLIQKAEGMFQYVACQFDILSKLRRPEAIRQALRDLPQGLDATYDRMLLSIDPKYRNQVASMLKWLAFSLRPLTVNELAEIFILDLENDPPFDDEDRLLQSKDVVKYLPGIVTTDETDYRPTTIRLAHFSIKEYLTSERIKQHRNETINIFSTTELESHLHISEACLTYHLHLSQTILATKEECLHFELWVYVAQAWFVHLESAPREYWSPTLTERILQVLTPKSRALLNMIRIRNTEDKNYGNYHDTLRMGIDKFNWSYFTRNFDTMASPLYYTAHDGAQLCSLLLDNGAAVDELSPARGESALYRAAYLGRDSTVRLLLDRGADMNICGGKYGNPLQAAAYKGHENIVRILLDGGADINIPGGEYGSAIYAAVQTNHQGITRLLLSCNADPTAPGGKFGNALQAAAYLEYKSIVRLMLDQGADINTRGGFFGTALQAAAYGNADQSAISGPSRDTIRFLHFLLNRGADINAQGGYFGNALQAAIAKDRYQVVKMLVSRGAELAPQEGHWQSLISSRYGERLLRFQKDPIQYLAVYEAEAKLLSESDDWNDDLFDDENTRRFESWRNNDDETGLVDDEKILLSRGPEIKFGFSSYAEYSKPQKSVDSSSQPTNQAPYSV